MQPSSSDNRISEVNQDPEKTARTTVEDNTLYEGTYHQRQLGSKARRKTIFSPLDHEYAEAVNRDAAKVEFTEAEEVRAEKIK
jgi:hypothetical protein